MELQQGVEEQQKFHNMLREQMQISSQRKALATAVCQAGATLIVAPLLTISTSMQLSRPNEAVSIE